MPEGPEIRRAADQVARAIVGRRAECVRFGLPALRRYERDLAGRRVEAVESRGKALLVHFDHGRSLGALLLDQGFLAGIGNYLRSEILFVAGLRADQKLADLDEADSLGLAEAALSLTRQSYRSKGITNDLERAVRLKAEGLPFGRYRHHVFDREGEPCWTCGTKILRLSAAGRSIFECPRCQRA